MSLAKEAQIRARTRGEFPAIVRQAVHDLSQPLQALRMMLGLPDAVIDDDRGLGRKVDAALGEMDRQLTQLHALSRVLDENKSSQDEALPFLKIVSYAQSLSPDLWGQLRNVRVYGQNCPMLLPSKNIAWVLNAILEASLRMRPETRVIVGIRTHGKWVGVADDGDGLTQRNAEALEQALNGGLEDDLGSGLLLARLLVAGWAGRWRVISKEGKGTIIAFSLPDF